MDQNSQEADIRDYIILLLKRKWFILAILLSTLLVSLIFSLLTKKVYKIESSLEIGTAETPVQVQVKTGADIYGILARKNLGILEENYPLIAVWNPERTNLIKMKIESTDTELAKMVLGEIMRSIISEHDEKIKNRREALKNNIKITENKIKLIDSDIEKTRNKIKPSENDIKRIENKIIFAEEEKNNLEAKIEALQKVLPFQQDPGAQFALFDTKEKLANKKQEIETLYSKINSLKIGLEDLRVVINASEKTKEDYYAHINDLRLSLDNIKSTTIAKDPVVFFETLKPKIKVNLIIAGVLGLFAGILLVFAREWWKNNRRV